MANVSSSNGLEKYPKLRFPGFTEPWQPTVLSSVFAKNTKKNTDGQITNVICNSAKQGLIPQREYFDKDIANSDNTSGYYIIEENDFVYNPRKSADAPYGPISNYKCAEAGIVSPLYLCFRARKEINPAFFEWYFRSSVWHRYVYMSGDSGARHDRVSIKDDIFFAMPINIPSTGEQGRIASFLEGIDRRIEKQRALVEALKKYKRGLLYCFFEDTSSWHGVKIGDLGIVVTGSTPPTSNPSNYTGDGLFCAPGDLGKSKYIASTEKHISQDALNKSRKIPKGSILVTCIGSTIGKMGIANNEMLTNQQINSLIVSEEYCGEFIYYALQYYFPQFLSCVGKQAVPILSKGQFEDLQVCLPTFDTQQKYAGMLSVLDTKIEQEMCLLECMQRQRNGLMQQLFI